MAPPFFFFGLSGAGKSTLMRALCVAHPHLFAMPKRLTTRPPKTGDAPDELAHVTREEMAARASEGSLLFVMRQSAAVDSHLSAYALDVLSHSRIPLLFCSVFNVEDARAITGAILVHVVGDWRRGLSLRGGKEAADRASLNESVARHFAELERVAHVTFANSYNGEVDDARRLFVELVHARALQPLSLQSLDAVPPSLSDVGPFIVAGNARRLEPQRLGVDHLVSLSVCEGVGQAGDLVVGDVIPPDGASCVRVRGADGVLYEGRCGQPMRVIAPLGDRMSSTHVSGGVPAGGIAIRFPHSRSAGCARQEEAGVTGATVDNSASSSHCAAIAWLAGESGLVGVLQHEPSLANALAEHSVNFLPVGLVCYPTGHPRAGVPVNIRDTAVVPRATALSTPLLVVAATSAEAGKTTLSVSLIARLRTLGLRVGAVKATGTGGTQDPNRLRSAGAHVVYDQVDAGLASTYVTESAFLERALVPYLAAQDAGVDVTVVELGGDIMWANNGPLLRLRAFAENIARLFVIANDPMAAIGTRVWLTAEAPLVPAHVVSLVASPFRNLEGMRRRADAVGMGSLMDPNDASALVESALDALRQRREGRSDDVLPQRRVVDASAGQSAVMESYWEQKGGLRALCVIAPSHRMGFELATHATAIERVTDIDEDLVQLLRAAHAHAGNARVHGHELVLGVGSRQLMQAALYALRRKEGRRLRLTARAPYYPVLGRLARVAPDVAVWVGAPSEWSGGLRGHDCEDVVENGECVDGPLVEIVVSPSNPTGAHSEASEEAVYAVHDLAYAWPHFGSREHVSDDARAHDIMLFSMSKLSGHAASRFGWAWVRDPSVAADMREFIRHSTIGVSCDTAERVKVLLRRMFADGGAFYDALTLHVRNALSERWKKLSDVVEASHGQLRLFEPRVGWCYAVFCDEDGSLRASLESLDVRVTCGEQLGRAGIVRVNMMLADGDFEEMVVRLASLRGST